MTASKPLDARISGPLCGCVLALTCCLARPVHATIRDVAWTVGDSAAVDSVVATPEPEPAKPDSTAAITAAEPTLSDSAATTYLESTLPFGQNELPHSYPEVSIAFGIAGYASSLNGVEEAFNKMEQVYNNAGYPVSSGKDISLGPMFLATLTLRLNQLVDVAVQAGQTQDSDNKIKLVGGIVSGHLALRDARSVSLQAGVGGGNSGFSFTRHYGQQVSPVDGSGGYYSLDSIELHGGGAYWTTQGGVTIRMGPHGALSGLIQYVGMGDVSTTTAHAGDITVNTSGIMFGVSCALFF